MKFIRENGVYLVLAFTALVLIFFTVMLQSAILATQPDATASNESGIWYTVRKQVADLILPATNVPTLSPSAPNNTPAPLPTSTPAVIILQATAVTLPRELTTETLLLPTSTEPPPLATVAPTLVPTDIATTTIVISADLMIGFVRRDRDCTVMTEIAAQLIREQLMVTVATQLFDSPEQLFDALAAQEVDITLCYTDPDDRSLMRTRLGLIRQIGRQHFIGDGYKLQIWANGNSRATLRDDQRCVLDFLEKIDFTTQNPQGQDPATWLQNNQSVVDGWLTCAF